MGGATNEYDQFNHIFRLFVDLLCLVLHSDFEWEAVSKVC